MTSSASQISVAWIGGGSTSVIPPADYWVHLARVVPVPQVRQLQQQSDERVNEFSPDGLGPPKAAATELLERVAADGWLEPTRRQRCPNCEEELSADEAAQPQCPHCGDAYSEHGGVSVETVYVRALGPDRDVDWVVAIHGMNTTGAWQETFSWHLGTTWGQSVPVAIYKYGIIIAGVIMAWRRCLLRDNLREKLVALRDEAHAKGFEGRPDVIAHSFGTWLLGHLLREELKRKPSEQLKFGRIILTGCILRPDFDWTILKEAGLVGDVLNHYGSKDRVVPLAQLTIWDSGPTGRRGFDSDQVLNIRAEGCGHSDLFSTKKCVVNGKCLQRCTGRAGEMSQLEHSYKRYWRPFLTLPREELHKLPDLANPATPWTQLPWPLRGTLFPVVALPLILALIALLVAAGGRGLWEARVAFVYVAMISAIGLSLILLATAITALWRRLRS